MGLNITISEGEIVGLIAPYRTGKTTLLKTIASLLPIDQGKITINDCSITQDKSRYLKQVFFLENSEKLYSSITVKEHLNYVKKMWDSKKSVTSIIQQFGLETCQNQRVKHLNLEKKQQLVFAMYRMSDCSILLFDEPLRGLNPDNVWHFTKQMKALQEEGKSVLISFQNSYNVENICSKVVFMKEKKIVYETINLKDIHLVYKVIFEEEGSL